MRPFTFGIGIVCTNRKGAALWAFASTGRAKSSPTSKWYVFAYQQNDADHYETIGKIATRPGAGTSFWSPELNRYYVAAPAHDNEEAAILVFEPES